MIYRFAGFELDPSAGTLSGPDGVVSLRKQSCQLLEVLLERAPEVLDRDELLDLAWGRTALSPTVVPQAISELRRALSDDAQTPRYIETLHRRGYRFICPVETVPGALSVSDTSPLNRGDRGKAARKARWYAATAALTVLALAVVSLSWWHHDAERRWLEQEAIPEIRELAETDRVGAWARLRDLRDRVPGHPLLEQFWLDLSLPVSLTSKPPGASVEVRGYSGDAAEWIELGRTPLENVRLPLAQMRFRLSLAGYRTLEAAPSVLPAAEPFLLSRPGQAPAGMVRVPAGRVSYLPENTGDVSGFWIDRLEVTNREYREFVDAGGYRDPAYWKQTAYLDGRELSHEELMSRLVDSTGMPGPSTWVLGTYPDGEADHPVEGISWFEAAAYARYAGKQLPTAYHWYRAAGLGTLPLPNFSGVLAMSNFGGEGTTAVGALGGLGPYGTLDMAGNVAEWTSNSAGEKRHVLGGSWATNSYQFRDPNAQHPLDRRPGFGLRLVRTDAPIQTELTGNIPLKAPDVPAPVDDDTFTAFARQFDYDSIPLAVRIEEVDASHRDWRRERVSFMTAYGERMPVHVFLPEKGKPPYQAVVHMPGGDALMLDDSENAGLTQVELFLRSGRAVVYPVYAGTFERRDGFPAGPASYRDVVVDQVRDLLRTVDYLQTRQDIDDERLLLHALSYGALRAPLALAVDDRFRAAILLSVGLRPGGVALPEVQLQNYLPRVTEPVLLITGRDDFNFPLETSHKPFFELLGTPDDRKRHLIRDWGHIPPHDPELIRAHLDWTARWLGPETGVGSP